MPVLVLAGDSDVSKEERVSKIRKEFPGDYIRIRSDDPEKLDLVMEMIRSVGMFTQKKIVDVVDFDDWKSKEKKTFIEILKEVPEDVYVVLRCSKPIKGFENETHSLPKPWERGKWLRVIESYFEKMGLKGDDEVLEYFLDVVGTDEHRIKSEVEKLSLYTSGEVRTSDIDEVVYRYERSTLDELCFSLSEMRYEDAHRIVDEVLKTFNPILVVGSVAKHFVDLFRLKATVKEKERYIWPDVSKASKELSIPIPKVARFMGFAFKGWKFKTVNHILMYDLETLSDILKRIYTIDRYVKGGMDPRTVLHEFVEILRGEMDVRHSGEVDIG